MILPRISWLHTQRLLSGVILFALVLVGFEKHVSCLPVYVCVCVLMLELLLTF